MEDTSVVYLLAIYTIGLAIMVLGFVNSPEYEKVEASPIPTLFAYIFWPLSLCAVAGYVIWETGPGTRQIEYLSKQ
jgi:hypothetical protein